jgi:spore coat protein U-like protein
MALENDAESRFSSETSSRRANFSRLLRARQLLSQPATGSSVDQKLTAQGEDKAVRRNHSFIKFALLPVTAMVLMAADASAQTATSTFAVTANVVSKCTITSTALAFSDYDPLVTNAVTPLDANGSVTVRCTKGTNSNIGLDLGLAPTGVIRRMSGGGDFLEYQLYKEAARNNVWGNSGADLVNPGVSPSMAPRVVTVYGRVFAGQDVTSGGYSDSIVATITF